MKTISQLVLELEKFCDDRQYSLGFHRSEYGAEWVGTVTKHNRSVPDWTTEHGDGNTIDTCIRVLHAMFFEETVYD